MLIQLAPRAASVWLFQFMRFRVASESHLLCLSRVKTFPESKLSIGGGNFFCLRSLFLTRVECASRLPESGLFDDIAPHLPSHADIFTQVRRIHECFHVFFFLTRAKKLLEVTANSEFRATVWERFCFDFPLFHCFLCLQGIPVLARFLVEKPHLFARWQQIVAATSDQSAELLKLRRRNAICLF
jgi:hypothetical protein